MVTVHVPGRLSRRARVAVAVLVRVRVVPMSVIIMRVLRVRRRACVCRVVMTPTTEAQHGRYSRSEALQWEQQQKYEKGKPLDTCQHEREFKPEA